MNEEQVYLPSYYHAKLLTLAEPHLEFGTITDEADRISLRWRNFGIAVSIYPTAQKGERRRWAAGLKSHLEEMRAHIRSGGRVVFTVEATKGGEPCVASVYSIEVDGGPNL